MNHLTRKTALITGSTSGIGLGLARHFSKLGVNILMNGFGEPEEIETLRQEIESNGVRCIYNGADMSKPAEIETMIAEAAEELGSIDILINNAGFQHVAPVEDFPLERWDAMIAVILSAAFHTIHHSVPLMKKQGWGRIINIASAHALVASPYKAGYVAAKHGVLGLTKVIGLELAEENITVNAICPGYVHTPLVDNQLKDTAIARGITKEEVMRDVLLKAQWTKKFVAIEEIAAYAEFLCSDAAQNITGAAQSIDGGWVAA